MLRLRQKWGRVRKSCHLDLGDYRHSVLLAGSGRSGTTWVEDIINCRNDYRMMFEPFHSLKVDLLKDWNYRQYLRSDQANEKFLEPTTAILSGRIRHRWVDQFNKKVIARQRLIKDIRVNLMLKWIKQRFPEIPIILLLRHPCAVANSRTKLGWDTHLDVFLIQDDLMADFLNPFREEIQASTDPFDRHILMWCIENFVPLRQFSPGEMLVVFYENLCTRPQAEIARIMAFLGHGLGQDSPESARALAAQPSAMCRDTSAVRTGKDVVESWRSEVTAEQQARALAICRLFGLDAVYDEASLPKISGEAALEIFPATEPAQARISNDAGLERAT